MTELKKHITTNSEYPIPPRTTDEPENMRKVGFRAAEVLVALEEMGGSIETPNLTRLVKDINDYQDGDGATSYHRTVSGLSKRGYVESTKDNKIQHLQLLPEGYEVVGLLKQYLGKISEKHQDRLEKGTAFKIIEYVIEHAAYVDDEGNYWLFNKGSTNDGIPMSMGLELGISDEAFSRRFYSLRKDKGWMCYEFDPDSDLDGIKNVGVTPDGFDYYIAVLDKFKDEDKLPHQELIDTVEKLVLTGIEHATRNEDRDLMKEFMTLGSPSDITEMDDNALQVRITEIRALLDTINQQMDLQVAA